MYELYNLKALVYTSVVPPAPVVVVVVVALITGMVLLNFNIPLAKNLTFDSPRAFQVISGIKRHFMGGTGCTA